jgi:hypothetical protein
MTLIVDVDLDLLKELHEARSVSLKIAELIWIKKNKSMNKTCLECGENCRSWGQNL